MKKHDKKNNRPAFTGMMINVRKSILSLAILGGIAVSGGCVPYHQLGERLIVQSIAIDYEEDMFVLTAEYFGGENPDGKKSKPQESLFLTEGRGSSISHALQEAGVNAGKPLILTDCQMFIIGSALRDRPLMEIMDVLVNEYEGYPNVTLAVTDGTASDIVRLMYKDESFSENKYHKILTESRELGFTPPSDLYTVVRNLSNRLGCAYLPVLKIVEADTDFSESGNYVIIDGGALYKDNMYLGNVDADVAAGIAFMENSDISTSITIIREGLSTLININNIEIKMQPEFTDNKLKLKIVYEVSASYSESRINYETDEIEEVIGKAIDERILKGLTETINVMGVDVVGLEENVRSKCYSGWKKLSVNWGEEIKDCVYSFDGTVRINKYGIRW